METVILWFWSPYATANKSLSLKPEAEKIPHLRMDLPAQHFQMRWCSTTSNNWSTSCLMTWALPKKIAPGILPWWHSLNWRHWRTCELGRSNPKTGEENAGEDWMKNIKKNVKTQELNVVKGMTVFRLCGETHLKMLVNGQSCQKQRSCSAHSTAASGACESTSYTTENSTNTSDKNTLQGCTSTNFHFKCHTTGQSASSLTEQLGHQAVIHLFLLAL